MGFIDELKNEFLTKGKSNADDRYGEEIAINFLKTVDFKDFQNQQEAKAYIKHILNDFVAKNEEIHSYEAKIVHYMIAKITLENLGLSDTKINYMDKDSQHGNAAAFYSDSDNSINFFNQSVCNKYDLLLPSGYTNETLNSESRLGRFAHEIFKQQHEIQHAVQFQNIKRHMTDAKELTSDDYITSMQHIARILSFNENSKYFKKDLDVDRLYKENHDQFYYEIDADKCGYERTLSLLEELSPKAYETVLNKNNQYSIKLNNKISQLENYFDIGWGHDTNPENVKVCANHKAAMIIDNVLPILDVRERRTIMQEYPALQIVHNLDGKRKPLEQIEKEYAMQKSHILINGSNDEIKNIVPRLTKMYETVIESDPVLSFEKCMQHIVRMSYDSDRYFTNSGSGVKYNPDEICKEIRLAKQKAMKISAYFEDTQAKYVKGLYDKYTKELFKSKIRNPQDLRYFEMKKLAIYDIDAELHRNQEVQKTIKNDAEMLANNSKIKKMEKEEAEKIIKNIFPNFEPQPQIGILSENGLELKNNGVEKLLLMESYKQYINTIQKSNDIKQDKDFISSINLVSAINKLYDFSPTDDDRCLFDENEIETIKNKYEIEDMKADENEYDEDKFDAELVQDTINEKSDIETSDESNREDNDIEESSL